MGLGVTHSLDDGSWRNTEYLFVRNRDVIDGEKFFTCLGSMTTNKNLIILIIMIENKWIVILASCSV